MKKWACTKQRRRTVGPSQDSWQSAPSLFFHSHFASSLICSSHVHLALCALVLSFLCSSPQAINKRALSRAVKVTRAPTVTKSTLGSNSSNHALHIHSTAKTPRCTQPTSCRLTSTERMKWSYKWFFCGPIKYGHQHLTSVFLKPIPVDFTSLCVLFHG